MKPAPLALPLSVALVAAACASRPPSSASRATPVDRAPASWIWLPGEPNPRNGYVQLRRSFVLGAAPRSARVRVSASAVADLYVNGALVDRVPVNSDPEHQVYEELDLAPLLRAGENVVAALVHVFGTGMHHRLDARGGFFLEGSAVAADGTAVSLDTGAAWRAADAVAWDRAQPLRAPGPHLIGYRERYDARKETPGWNAPGFDGRGFVPVQVIGPPPVAPWNGALFLQRPPLRRAHVAARSLRQAGDGVWIADLGREVVGHPTVRLRAAEGAALEIGTAERLKRDGTPDTTHSVDYRDTYVARDGTQTFQPFAYRAFRYVRLQATGEVTVDEVGAETRGWPVEERGAFASSDPVLDEIWRVGRYSTSLCMQDTYMDTPWREQTQYIAGDSRYLMRFAHHAFTPTVEPLARYNLLSGAFSQRWSRDGAIRGRYPTDWLLGPNTSTYIPDYQLEWVLMLAEHHRYYARPDLPRAVWPSVVALLAYFERHVSPDTGLLGPVPGWTVLDHPDTYPMDVKGHATAMNALYHGALRAAARLAREVMNDSGAAAAWDARARRVHDAVNRELWSDERRAYVDGKESARVTPQTQAYALLYGLVPPERSAGAVDVIRRTEGHAAEQSFSYWVLHAMFDAGEDDWALAYIRRHWGAQMKLPTFNGAWHEAWDQAWGSTSHGWSSGPTALLIEKVLGVEPLAPAYRRFALRPRTGGLTWAAGRVATASGDVSVRWERAADGFSLRAMVPQGTEAEVTLPFAPRALAVDGAPAAASRTFVLRSGAHDVRAAQ